MKKTISSLRLLSVLAASLAAIQSIASDKVENWYTVTILPKTPYAYYRETLDHPNGRVRLTTQMWKKEEGFINEEQLGAYALDNDLLTPLFFNFHSTYRSSELTIDGTANQSQLTVRIKRNNEDSPIITKSLPSKAIFSSLFPVLLKKRLIKKEPKGSFLAILEDNETAGFSPVNGTYSMTPPDEFAKASNTTRIEVDFSDNKSYWYLDSKGTPVRIDMPAQKTLVERVTEAKAKAFFGASTQ